MRRAQAVLSAKAGIEVSATGMGMLQSYLVVVLAVHLGMLWRSGYVLHKWHGKAFLALYACFIAGYLLVREDPGAVIAIESEVEVVESEVAVVESEAVGRGRWQTSGAAPGPGSAFSPVLLLALVLGWY